MTRKREVRRNVKWDGALLIMAVAVMLSLPKWQAFKDSRTFHDLMGITAFSSVTSESVVVPDGIVIQGSLVKVRCKFAGLVAYVTLESGARYRFPVDTSVEDATGVSGNRPVSGRHEHWGPWKIRYSGGLGVAVAWEVFAQHVPLDPVDLNCNQNNLFASGEWVTTQ